jgi:amino acid adenylation domain-containing protein
MQKEMVNGYRLSPQQERLWLLYQKDHSKAYCAQCSILIEGKLDKSILRAAVKEVVAGHEILRTTFYSLPEMIIPVQVILEEGRIEDAEYDLSRLEEQEQARAIDRIFHQAKQQRFNFEHGPLLRASLLILSSDLHILILTLPALCVDMVGLYNVVSEIGSCYTALLSGEQAPEAQLQYADVAEWLHEMLESEETVAGREYWNRMGTIIPPAPALPFERTSGGNEVFWCEVERVTVAPEVAARVNSLVKERAASIADFLLACWFILLWKITRQPEIVIGVEFNGRKYGQLKEVPGLLSRYLPISCKLQENFRFSDFLKQAGEAVHEANRWQESFSQERLSKEQEGKAEADYQPFAFTFYRLPEPCLANSLTFSIREQYVCTGRFSIKPCVVEKGASLLIEFHYDPNRFREDDISRLAAEFYRLVESASDGMDSDIAELDIISEPEMRFLLYDLNQTQVHWTAPHLTQRLVERQIEHSPDAVAAVFEGEHLTYLRLNERANQFAHYLRARGVGPDALVGICVERSLQTMVAVLGILKAGGAYLPLDPALPSERLKLILTDARPRLVITQMQFRESLQIDESSVVYLDRDWSEFARESKANPVTPVGPDNLAYVIYTSGSTGQPKGVMISHRSICNRLLWMQEVYPLRADDTLLQKTALSFDASVWELFLPLMVGARLVMARPGGQQDSAYLLTAVIERQVTTLQLIPSMLEVLLEEPGVVDCRSLRRVFCGGEALPVEAARKFHLLLGADLINLYGPTEASIDATHWECKDSNLQQVVGARGIVPIGRPLANAEVFIFDGHLRPAPLEVAGELYIGGVGLARAYLNRPELTAERFIPHLYCRVPGKRLFKTGDFACQGTDGNCKFLGRADDQVKLRGFRIELGEIEAALRQNQEVREAIVTMREDAPGGKRLVAYIVLRSKGEGLAPEQEREPGGDLREAPGRSELSASGLHEYLRKKLPEYMLPSAFVFLDSLPTLSNGKVDRRALPEPIVVRGKPERALALPRTPIDETLAGIWSDVLGIESVGAHDDFFELGGHSLLATQVISRIRKVLQVEVGLRGFLENPTIDGLGEKIRLLRGGSRELTAPPLTRVERLPGGAPVSFAQHRLWFMDQLLPGSPLYNIPTSFRMRGGLNVYAAARTMGEIVRRQESLRTTFDLKGEQPIQIISESIEFILPLIDLSALPDEQRNNEVKRIARQEAQKPFDLRRGPLMRATLLRFDERDHILLLVMHHIISDGWSITVLIKEIATLYEAFAADKPSPLDELPIQYADFAAWQRSWLQGETLEAHLDYWKRKLGGSSGAIRWMANPARRDIQRFQGERRIFSLSTATSREVKALGRREGSTLFMTLLSAYAALLNRYSEQDDIVVGTDIANRNRIETESLIGFFANQLVLRIDLSGDPTFRELLARVREVTLEAYDHQDLPFEKLVEALNPDRSGGGMPLFQTKLILQNAPSEKLETPGLALSLGDVFRDTTSTAKFDLSLTAVDTGQALQCAITYSADLFDSSDIERLFRDFEILLGRVAADPDTRLSALRFLPESERTESEARMRERRDANIKRFKSTKPRARRLEPEQLVRADFLSPQHSLPIAAQPNVEDLDFFDWVRSNNKFIETNLSKYGGMLFRGFGLSTQEDFQQFLAASSIPLMKYMEGATPRTELEENIYTSTEYPPELMIALHNELNYVITWPMRICFFCQEPSPEGGETPIADVRKVLNRMHPKVVEQFAQKGWMLVRNFKEGLSLAWQTSYHTDDKAELEAYFRRSRIDWEWKNGGRELTTRQVRPAIARHPGTGESVWFNHIAFWHVSSLESKFREALLSLMKEEDLPYNTYYGDGSPIEDSVVAQIRDAYREETVAFPWQKGDILLLDNMLVAHGRNSYRGPRKILAAMGEEYTRPSNG